MQQESRFERIDRVIAGFMSRFGHLVLRICLGVIYIWFGLLKPLGMSPAADLVAKTTPWLPASFMVPFVGWWEVLIGLCLLVRPLLRVAIALLFLQMLGTFAPLVLLPQVTFTTPPFGLTIEGQYIIKNLLIIGAALVIGGTVRRTPTGERYM
jgi:uncharacterized membrane protein YphA (DoxX/SURF4 family)